MDSLLHENETGKDKKELEEKGDWGNERKLLTNNILKVAKDSAISMKQFLGAKEEGGSLVWEVKNIIEIKNSKKIWKIKLTSQKVY